MNFTFLDALGMLGMSAPFLVIVAILVQYNLQRAAWKGGKRLGRKPSGTYPSSFALGMALPFLQVYYRPNIVYEIEAKLVEELEEADQGDPEAPARHLHRQLRRIRRGEPVDRLVIRL